MSATTTGARPATFRRASSPSRDEMSQAVTSEPRAAAKKKEIPSLAPCRGRSPVPSGAAGRPCDAPGSRRP